MKNSLQDLENHLFHQIENIMQPEDGMDAEKEIRKSKAIADLAEKILKSRQVQNDTARSEIDACNQKIRVFELANEYGVTTAKLLEIENGNQK